MDQRGNRANVTPFLCQVCCLSVPGEEEDTRCRTVPRGRPSVRLGPPGNSQAPRQSQLVPLRSRTQPFLPTCKAGAPEDCPRRVSDKQPGRNAGGVFHVLVNPSSHVMSLRAPTVLPRQSVSNPVNGLPSCEGSLDGTDEASAGGEGSEASLGRSPQGRGTTSLDNNP